MQTTTNLPVELRNALTAAGLTPQSAFRVVLMLPPPGQRDLRNTLRVNPDALHALATMWIADLADQLHVTHDVAEVLRARFQAVTA